VFRADRESEKERWRPRRQRIYAHVWLYSNAGSGDAIFRTQAPKWTIEDYIEGNLETGEGWQDFGDDRSERYGESRLEEREVVYSGSGHLDYVRADYFTGW